MTSTVVLLTVSLVVVTLVKCPTTAAGPQRPAAPRAAQRPAAPARRPQMPAQMPQKPSGQPGVGGPRRQQTAVVANRFPLLSTYRLQSNVSAGPSKCAKCDDLTWYYVVCMKENGDWDYLYWDEGDWKTHSAWMYGRWKKNTAQPYTFVVVKHDYEQMYAACRAKYDLDAEPWVFVQVYAMNYGWYQYEIEGTCEVMPARIANNNIVKKVLAYKGNRPTEYVVPARCRGIATCTMWPNGKEPKTMC